MKKIYLTMLALLAFAGTKAQTTWTETDWQSMDDVVALKSSEFLQGSGVVEIPICIKAHTGFLGATFFISLPNGLTVSELGEVSDGRDGGTMTGVTIAGNDLGDGTYMVLTTIARNDSNNDPIYFTPGSTEDEYIFASIKVDISSLKPGEYPMKIVGETHFSKFDDGQPNIIFNTEITTKLVIFDEVILDEMYTTFPGTYEDVKVRVRRTISAGNWSTICLPFAMSERQCKEIFGEDVKIADLNDYEVTFASDGYTPTYINVKFDYVTEMEANHPYIIKIEKEEGITEFTLEGVNITPVDNPCVKKEETIIVPGYPPMPIVRFTFTGTYVNETVLDDKDYLFLNKNKFYYSNGSTKMKGYRAYFKFANVLGDKTQNIDSKIRFEIGGEATSIDGMASAEKIKGVYTVSGVKVAEDSLEGLPKGVYIVNGKKVLVK